jgi:hypothetical protein
MKKTTIRIHHNRNIELFVEKRNDGFEIWIVGLFQKKRLVLDHHLTHDDLEARLEYANCGDMLWCEAENGEIPDEKHQNAIEAEKNIATFWDYEKLHQSVAGHLSAIVLLSTDTAEQKVTEQALLGRWTDGIVTVSFESNNRLQWSCVDRQHPLNVGERVHGHAPDWWNFGLWEIALLNNDHKCGTRVHVLRVDEQELHFFSNHPHRIAHVFRRVSPPKEITSRGSNER